MDELLNNWFVQEILPHEVALVRYLTRVWHNRQEIHDLRQETYVRVYEAARKARPHSPKPFLFSTARNLMADRIRRGRVVSIEAVGGLEVLDVSVEEISPERRLHARQELVRLARAFRSLPTRCREVLWMRRVDGLSQKQVASTLAISEKTVESHLLKGTRLLADALFSSDSRSVPHRGQVAIRDELEDGQQSSD